MRVTLVERQEPRLRCVPDLGIAYLIGQCKQEGIKTSLVSGSPKTLDCLLDDNIFDLFLQGYKDVVKERGESWFKEFLKFNYDIATSNNIWDKTNPEALQDLWDLVTYMRDFVWPSWLPGYLFNEIEKTKPDVVGFSLWDFYDNPELSKCIATVIDRLKQHSHLQPSGLKGHVACRGQHSHMRSALTKCRDPAAKLQVRNLLEPPRILIGGPGTVTQSARKDIFKMFNPDFIVHHEGELALIELLQMIEQNKIKKRPNISFKGCDADNKPIEDLNSIALPDFSHYDLDSFFLPVRVLPIMTSRGCSWSHCAFCNHHATYKGYREHSVDKICETIERYKKDYKTDMIMFHDETFTSKRARSIVDKLPKANYYTYAYPKGFDKPLLKKMHDKGFKVIVWGVESGCQNVLNSMRKGTNINEVEQIIRDAHDIGITNVTFIMFGFPGETEKQAEETIEFLKRNSPYIERHATTQFRLEEDSPIWEKPALWGVKRKGFDYSVEKGMNRGEVKKFLKGLNEKDIKTCANTKYYMPGDSEFRAYFFMQVAYGENSGDYPVRNGTLVGNEIWPSLLMKNVCRPKLVLNEEQLEVYKKCDGKHKVNATEFEEYPYVINYQRHF